MNRSIETVIIYSLLALFAVWGVSYLAPAVADQLAEVLVTAANQK